LVHVNKDSYLGWSLTMDLLQSLRPTRSQ